MKRILLALFILLGLHSAASAQALPSWSLWQNQRGSTLEVYYVDPSGPFTGTFTNRAPGYQCQGIPYPAQGITRGPAVTFAVTFTQCSSHTTWFGTVSGNTMRTNWIMIYTPPVGPPQKSTGTDIFTRVR
ncbi:avidin/streptavidin family protein [Bradyrhizobium sp. BR 10289]|uniref:avidin/streptavidin family protein n=1 Tax=Bradyrhizobium sp. BR 10289 TaxID=2749993 RepID=UPI001C651EDC|nr:avidin/streptavidin family protein [Bradyrhizobium sp. BR 10289]MBW7970613.1 hypothetical protein [Bradyrhizobium sp. BR 10289]